MQFSHILSSLGNVQESSIPAVFRDVKISGYLPRGIWQWRSIDARLPRFLREPRGLRSVSATRGTAATTSTSRARTSSLLLSAFVEITVSGLRIELLRTQPASDPHQPERRRLSARDHHIVPVLHPQQLGIVGEGNAPEREGSETIRDSRTGLHFDRLSVYCFDTHYYSPASVKPTTAHLDEFQPLSSQET
jgi:hypothetical protein